MSGNQTANSCGEKSALAVMTKLSRKYKDENTGVLKRCCAQASVKASISFCVSLTSDQQDAVDVTQ